MKIRVLGCSGAIAKGCRTTSFLINDSVLVDAGTGVGDLTLDEMAKIDHVFLTHSHMDHIASLPMMLDAVSSARVHPVVIHTSQATILALQKHVFNDVIWPNFNMLPVQNNPFMRYCAIECGQEVTVDGILIRALPALHTVPALGFAALGRTGWWVFSGDTGGHPDFWVHVNAMPVSMLVIETAFGNREKDLAYQSQHLSPSTLKSELAKIITELPYPIYVTHTKPSEAINIMKEIGDMESAGSQGEAYEIHWLQTGQIFEV